MLSAATRIQNPSRPVVRYHGGKWRLAPWVIAQFPAHKTYVEPFGGAASVLLRKPRCHAEIYNDQWGDIVNVFRVLREPASAAELERRIRLTPFSRDEFELSSEPAADPVEWARRMIYRSMAGFGSDSVRAAASTGFRSNSNRSGTTPAHDWMHYPEQIERFTSRLQGVVIENRDALEVMAKHDSESTLHYVDPPYVHETRKRVGKTRGYAVEMTNGQHELLASFLSELKGMVILSGYRCALYDRAFATWLRMDVGTHADGARDRVESIWISPRTTPPQRHLLDGVCA